MHTQSHLGASAPHSKLFTISVAGSLPSTGLDLNNPAVLKLLEQGGFIALLLALSLFFWVLTQFVKGVKAD